MCKRGVVEIDLNGDEDIVVASHANGKCSSCTCKDKKEADRNGLAGPGYSEALQLITIGYADRSRRSR